MGVMDSTGAVIVVAGEWKESWGWRKARRQRKERGWRMERGREGEGKKMKEGQVMEDGKETEKGKRAKEERDAEGKEIKRGQETKKGKRMEEEDEEGKSVGTEVDLYIGLYVCMFVRKEPHDISNAFQRTSPFPSGYNPVIYGSTLRQGIGPLEVTDFDRVQSPRHPVAISTRDSTT